jgi:transposase
MKRIPKQEYTAAFKEQAVAMVKGGKTAAEAARALGLVEQTLRNWVKLAGKGKLHNGVKNSRLKLEVEILKKATAYFAKDAL